MLLGANATGPSAFGPIFQPKLRPVLHAHRVSRTVLSSFLFGDLNSNGLGGVSTTCPRPAPGRVRILRSERATLVLLHVCTLPLHYYSVYLLNTAVNYKGPVRSEWA